MRDFYEYIVVGMFILSSATLTLAAVYSAFYYVAY